jgi:hypothetical protein
LFKEAGCGNSIARLREGVYSFATVLRAHSRNVPSMVLAQLFTRHPASVGETYLQHLCTAATFGLRMLAGGLACVVHALLPFLFERTASRYIEQLYQQMVLSRTAPRPASPRGERG